MINEDYCSYEVAKLLKEKGFDEPVQYFYKFDSKELYRGTIFTNTQIGYKFYNAPTHQMAMKWLREKGLHINVSISYDYSEDADGNIVDKWTFWLFEIFSSFGGNLIYTEEVNEYDSYEEAVEAALKYSLINIV